MPTWPADCNTPAERTEFLYRAQEKLRLRHNAVGKRFRDGEITEAQWNTWFATWWEPRQNRVIHVLLQYRAQLKASVAWNPDTEDL